VQLTPTGAFQRCLKRLSRADAEDTLAALKRFVVNRNDKSLNFEKLRSRPGYYTIRSNYSVRVLLKSTGPDSFDIVIVGNHDYVYERYFSR
jgi:hypothetical protein